MRSLPHPGLKSIVSACQIFASRNIRPVSYLSFLFYIESLLSAMVLGRFHLDVVSLTSLEYFRSSLGTAIDLLSGLDVPGIYLDQDLRLTNDHRIY